MDLKIKKADLLDEYTPKQVNSLTDEDMKAINEKTIGIFWSGVKKVVDNVFIAKKKARG